MASITELLKQLAKATQETARGGMVLTSETDTTSSVQFFHNMVTSYGTAADLYQEVEDCVDGSPFANGPPFEYLGGLHQRSHQYTSAEAVHIHTATTDGKPLTLKQKWCITKKLLPPPEHKRLKTNLRQQHDELQQLARQGIAQEFINQCKQQALLAFINSIKSTLLHKYFLPLLSSKAHHNTEKALLKFMIYTIDNIVVMSAATILFGTLSWQQLLPSLVATALRLFSERADMFANLVEQIALVADMPTAIEKNSLLIVSTAAAALGTLVAWKIIHKLPKLKRDPAVAKSDSAVAASSASTDLTDPLSRKFTAGHFGSSFKKRKAATTPASCDDDASNSKDTQAPQRKRSVR